MLIPDDPDERQIYALRIVAQRCLYGVDKNPLAVEMAKLSLWLLTLAKDKPFEFLDHNIRCGDSLVGIHELKQLENLTISGEKQFAPVFLESLQSSIREAVRLRKQLMESPGNDPQQVEAQEALFRQASNLTAKLRAAADLLLADVFNKDQKGVVIVAAKFQDSTAEELQKEANKELGNRLTFHWPLEFPEVFQERGGFDAFVGNPPFMGMSRISQNQAPEFVQFLLDIFPHSRGFGRVDLCGFFFLRAFSLLRRQGCQGFLATNTIAQGDTRAATLDYIITNEGTIFRATKSLKWPGSASLEVSLIHIAKNMPALSSNLDGKLVVGIGGTLDEAGITGEIHRLKGNKRLAFRGSMVAGEGFVVTPEEAKSLLSGQMEDSGIILPYLTGDDFNSRHDLSPSRWIIDFGDFSLEKARTFRACFRHVEQHVYPQRLSSGSQDTRERWWQFGRRAVDLYETIESLERVLACAQTSKYLAVDFLPKGIVYSSMVVVFAFGSFDKFAMLQSAIHESWVRTYSSTLETRLRYTPTDSFETFPMPIGKSASESAGCKLHSHRKIVMLARQEGLTKTYNRFHAPDETSADIQKLRQLHVEMDQAVAAAYGWTDLDLGHGFHQTKQGLRYTISEPARREVLGRLLKLNHERYAEEVAKGLHEKKKRGAGTVKRGTKKKTKDEGNGLFS